MIKKGRWDFLGYIDYNLECVIDLDYDLHSQSPKSNIPRTTVAITTITTTTTTTTIARRPPMYARATTACQQLSTRLFMTEQQQGHSHLDLLLWGISKMLQFRFLWPADWCFQHRPRLII